MERVGIFWDFENCAPPTGLAGYKVVDRIRTAAHAYGSISCFKAYLEHQNQIPASVAASLRAITLRSELQSSGVSLIDCPHNGRKDSADFMMIVDVLTWAMDNPAPSTVLIISGDRDFSYLLAILRQRRYTVVLVPPVTSHVTLTSQANFVREWRQDVLGVQSEAAGSAGLESSSFGAKIAPPLPSMPPRDRAMAPPMVAPRRTSTPASSWKPPVLVEREYQPRQTVISVAPVKRPRAASEAMVFPMDVENETISVPEPAGPRLQEPFSFNTFSHTSPEVMESNVFEDTDFSSDSSNTDELARAANTRLPPSRGGTVSSCGPPLPGIPSYRSFSGDMALMLPDEDEVAVADFSQWRPPVPFVPSLPATSTFTTQGDPLASTVAPVAIVPVPWNQQRKYFSTLIEVLESWRNTGIPRPLRSLVGAELRSRNPGLYQHAGVSSFKDYINKALASSVVSIGGGKVPGREWIMLSKHWHGKVHV